eukprot:TRINITY_DN51_c0_g1_i5.p1 TRINITY_DN51_c0_g1~~TRINITY_DN51_c0_g1_i5.p1  ORF type:complete len:528 (-),score=155.75 TRINITY_DN51_c0_g1_i5:77-1621(-)
MQKELKPSRTQLVLEKWGVEGQMNDEDIRNAASSFARIRVKNTIMKWVAIGGVLFIATFIGLMIGSVVLGIEATKEYKVKEQVLVQNNGTALGTSEAFYAVNLKLTTSLSTVKGIKSLKFNRGDKGILHFNVVSFYFIPGRTLTFYGVNYVAEVLADGTVDVYPITSSNGARSIDEEKRDSFTEISGTGTGLGSTNIFTDINQCSDLLLIQETGKYQLTNSIDCTLTQPLLSSTGQSFRGIFNGHGHYISLTINSDGPVALFGALKQATIINLLLKGNITGVQSCAGLALETFPGTKFISSGVYANIECSNNGNTKTVIGSYSAFLRNENADQTPISWLYAVSQSHYTVALSDLSYPSYQGGFYGAALEKVETTFNFSYSAATPNQRGGNYKITQFGFKALTHSHEDRNIEDKSTEKKTHVYVPEDCYGYNKTSPLYINMCVEFFRENLYEEICCCASVNWDSCWYIWCSPQAQLCMPCRHTKKGEEPLLNGDSKSFETDPVQIVPTIQRLCQK